MSVATAIIELSKEMENKMNKTHTQLQDAIVAEIKREYPNDDLGMTYARFLGKLLAYAEKDTLAKILDHYTFECARCGEMVLASEHPEIGCDL
jgi:hypothetical protein